MSELAAAQASLSTDCPPGAAAPVAQRIEAALAQLGEGMAIRRALPTRHRRMVGPWCFLDHFGPAEVAGGAGLRVAPHPHIGLQTVTWLMEGAILHRDSLGHVQPIVPGELNVMTSGRGISHSEESPATRSPRLHGVQLWIALPEAERRREPAFEHHADLPRLEQPGLRATVFAGSLGGVTSPASVHSPLVGADLQLAAGAEVELSLAPQFEHAVLVTEGRAVVGGEPLAPGTLLYLGRGRSALGLAAGAATRLVLVGGEPFDEPVLMWWNFVARTRAEIATACRDWNAGAPLFGTVQGYDGAPLVAPLPPWAAA